MPRPRAASPGARFKDDLTNWFAKHPGVPFGSVKAIADSKLVHPLHQALFDEAAAAKPVDEDPVTIEDLKNEKRYQEAFPAAMDTARVDALIFPSWTQLPAINGDRNTQIVDEPTGVALHAHDVEQLVGVRRDCSLQWPAISVPSGYLGEDLPQGLQILGRPWQEERIIGYAFAYEQATRHRRPPSSTPPLGK